MRLTLLCLRQSPDTLRVRVNSTYSRRHVVCFIWKFCVIHSFPNPNLTPANMKGKPSGNQDKARNKFLACLFLAGASKQNETALTALNNDFIQGNQNAYPSDVLAARQFLANCRSEGPQRNDWSSFQPRQDNSFAQQQPPPNTNNQPSTEVQPANSRRQGRDMHGPVLSTIVVGFSIRQASVGVAHLPPSSETNARGKRRY